MLCTNSPRNNSTNSNDSGIHFGPLPKLDEATISQAKIPYDLALQPASSLILPE